MQHPLRVLLVEDNEDDAALIVRALTRGGCSLAEHVRVENQTDLETMLANREWDVVLSDYRLPGFSAPEALAVLQNHMRQTGHDLPFIVISGTIGEETAVAMMKAGAADYLLKENLRRLAPAVERELREAEGRRKRREAEAALLESESHRMAFVKDVLLSVTEGRLHLCDSRADLPPAYSDCSEPVKLASDTLTVLRARTREAAADVGLDGERLHDLVTAVSEAAMNAVVHAGGGEARVCTQSDGTIQVWVEDTGRGIALDRLPRATLERGYTTAGTLGHGFWLILQTCDRVYLLTGPDGTTVVLQQDRSRPLPVWLQGFGGEVDLGPDLAAEFGL